MAIGATALGAGGLITAGFTSGWDIGSMASGYMAGSLLGAACGAAYMLAPSAAFAGMGNKFTADITAFAFLVNLYHYLIIFNGKLCYCIYFWRNDKRIR